MTTSRATLNSSLNDGTLLGWLLNIFVFFEISSSELFSHTLHMNNKMSVSPSELAFSYECLGFTHQDIDMIFDWLRITPDERFMGGFDEVDGDVIAKSP